MSLDRAPKPAESQAAGDHEDAGRDAKPASLDDLVRAAQTGDAAAVDALIRRYQDIAYYTALRYAGEAETAREAAQEAFIEALRYLPSLRQPAAFPAWFRRLVFKQVHRRWRRRRPVQSLDDTRELLSPGPGPPAMLEQWQRQAAVRAAVRELPALYQDVTRLFYLEELTYAELVDRLALPLSTVKKRLYTARRLLHERLRPMNDATYRPSKDDHFTARVQFFLALKANDLLRIRQLVRSDPQLLTAETNWGEASDGWYWPLGTTALHWAAGTGNQPLAALLIELGAAVDQPDRHGNTPLKRAAHMGQAELVDWLLAQGADPGRPASNGQTPLHVAVIRGGKAVADAMLAAGADPGLADGQGRTAADWAVVRGDAALAARLGRSADIGLPRSADIGLPRSAGTAVRRPADREETGAVVGGVWETGIKIVDLVAPLRWGGRNGLFTPLSGIGIDVMLGELIHRHTHFYGGRSVQLGLERGDFTVESRAWQWRNCGVAEHVDLFFARADESPVRLRRQAEAAIRQALALAVERPVLVLCYSDLALTDGVGEILATLDDAPQVTLLFAGKETIGAEPPALAGLDAALTFDRDRARHGLWPAIDLVRSYSQTFADPDHRSLAVAAVRLARRYQDLQAIVDHAGLSGLAMALYDERDREAAIRARRLHRFLAQPLFVAEPWSATPGEFIALAAGRPDAETILHGELETAAEDELALAGEWSPAWT